MTEETCSYKMILERGSGDGTRSYTSGDEGLMVKDWAENGEFEGLVRIRVPSLGGVFNV